MMINIVLKMMENNDVEIKNEQTNKTIIINYVDKVINAKDVYDIICYEKMNKYELKTNIDSSAEEKVKEYFQNIIKLFEKILNEINNLSEKTNNES